MPTNCPTCDEEIEDDWHWINYDARLAWRDTQAGTLSGRLGMLETEPGVKIIFLHAFKSLLSTGNFLINNNNTKNYSANEQAVINSQSTIRWKQILFGRLSLEWLQIQDKHVATWATQVTKHTWQSLLALWLLQNKALQGDTFQENEATQRSRLLPLIK
jgi:hypothetical protein